MSKITLEPNSSGAGTFSIVSPDSNTNRTLNLPDESGTIFSDGTGVPGSVVTGQLASLNMPAGSVIQVVSSALFADKISTTSDSYVSTGHSINIAPLKSNSKILISLQGGGAAPIQSKINTTIYRDAINLGVGSDNSLSRHDGGISPHSILLIDEPLTTSTVTYEVYYRSKINGETVQYHWSDRGVLTLLAMEIAG